jgi:hypothetical protein
MSDLTKLSQNMTMTGIAMFTLGLITMIPEIYFTGILVTALSLFVEIKDLDKKRVEEMGLEQPTMNLT